MVDNGKNTETEETTFFPKRSWIVTMRPAYPEGNRLPLIISRSNHSISRSNISPEAIKVLYRLHRSGYRAYLVGGSVRDLSLHRQPKDFDVATDARPSRIRKLFRNSYLIGRRFRLAHIKFGDKTIEVSTFRSQEPGGDELMDTDEEPEETGVSSRVRASNTFGTAIQDAYRRDFTINALFYNIADFTVIDYVGGWHDLQSGIVRSIGDPMVRFREDPVRMIRAIRAAGRVGFAIEQKTYSAITALCSLIHGIPPPRLLEEILVFFKTGTSRVSLSLLQQTGLLAQLLPEIDAFLQQLTEERRTLFHAYLATYDHMMNTSSCFSPTFAWSSFFLACFHVLYQEPRLFLKNRRLTSHAFMELSELFKMTSQHLLLPRKHRHNALNMLNLIPWLSGQSQRTRPPHLSFYDDAFVKDFLNLWQLFTKVTNRARLFREGRRFFLQEYKRQCDFDQGPPIVPVRYPRRFTR